MSDRPILFSAPMIRALLESRKTQTRRALYPQPELQKNGHYHVYNRSGGVMNVEECDVGKTAVDYMRIRVGDRLWVREAWRTCAHLDEINPAALPLDNPFYYEADGGGERVASTGLLRPGIHMPRWASRITLTVTDVRVQRLQDISEEDAQAEGIKWVGCDKGQDYWSARYPGKSVHIHSFQPHGAKSPRSAFQHLWNSINGAGSWEENPWVAAYTFTVIRKNIDHIEQEAA